MIQFPFFFQDDAGIAADDLHATPEDLLKMPVLVLHKGLYRPGVVLQATKSLLGIEIMPTMVMVECRAPCAEVLLNQALSTKHLTLLYCYYDTITVIAQENCRRRCELLLC